MPIADPNRTANSTRVKAKSRFPHMPTLGPEDPPHRSSFRIGGGKGVFRRIFSLMDVQDRLARGLAGRYTVERLLGAGGMAQVFLAQDLKHRRPVALKVLRPEVSAAVGTERFLREIDVAAGLNHPNILALHDSGEADGLLYFVMPFVEGESLRARLNREGRLPLPEALRIAEEIGSALDYAHERGLVHRDIKPENILFQAGHALVADLGIAQVTSSEGERLTRTGIAVGTFTYMSPEQLTGEREIDGRSDVYSLGCLFYEMLSGTTPCEAPTPEASLARKLTGEVANLTEVRDDLPPTIQPVVDTSLAAERALRFATSGIFVERLREATSRAAVEADARRRRTRAALRYSATVLGILAMGVGGWLINRAMAGPIMDRIAVLPFENALGDPAQEYYVAGVYAELVAELSKTLLVTSRRSVETVAAMGLRPRDIAAELNADGLLGARISVSPINVELILELVDGETEDIVWTERFEAAQSQIFNLYRRVTQQIAQRLEVPLDEEDLARLAQSQEVDPRVHEALLQAEFHWQKLTAEGINTAEDYYRQAIELSDSMSAEAWWGLSTIPGMRAQMGLITGEEAHAAREVPQNRAIELGIDIGAQDGGYSAWSDWEFVEAEEMFRRKLELEPTNSVARVYFAQFLAIIGKDEEALEHGARAVADDPYNPRVWGLYGQFLNFVRRYDEAEAAFQTALDREPNDPISLSNFRTTYHLQGRFDEAMDLWREYYLRVAGDTLAVQALDRGYAEGGYQAALRAVAEEFASRDDGRLNWQIATLYTRAGDGDKALDYLDRAIAVRDPNMPSIMADPIFDFLRDEPRFQAMVDTVRAVP